jgi:hypothetical protein
MLKLYKKIKTSIASIQWDRSWDEEKRILEKLKRRREKMPDRPIFDSQMQYLAQTSHLNFLSRAALQTVSFFGLIYLVLKYLTRESFQQKYDVAFFYSKSIFPKKVKDEKSFVFIESEQGHLGKNELYYLLSLLCDLKFNFYLLAVSTYRIAQCNYALKKYSVSQVWSNMEYSCACGVLKDYLNKKDILLINFMHGEKILTLRDSFCGFDKMYFWNKHYLKIFRNLKYQDDFEIVDPFNSAKKKSIKDKWSFCYILKGTEDKYEIKKIVKFLNRLNEEGFNISVKPHPRNDINLSYFSEYNIWKDNDLIEMFDNHLYVCAQYSTILHQADLYGIHILIDDISNKDLTKALHDRKYHKFEKKYHKLSDFIVKL